MRITVRMLLLTAVVLLASVVPNASGAAVMSIDLGTEWFKVRFISAESVKMLMQSCSLRWASCHLDNPWRWL